MSKGQREEVGIEEINVNPGRATADSAATKFNLSSPENLLELIVAKECVVNLKGVGVAAGPTPESLSNIGAAVQAQLARMVAKSSGPIIENLPPKVKARVEFLKELQSQHDDMEAEYNRELEALNLKYQRLYDPLYAKRASIVSGEEEAPSIATAEGEASGGIPDFWLNVFRAEETIGSMISEKDEPILSHLVDVRCEDLEEADGTQGYRLHFKFEKNPYFEEEVLIKSYYVKEDESGEMELERAEGTAITWKPGRNPTVKVMKKKPKPGRSGQSARVITKEEPTLSFFNFFSPPVVPDEDDDIEDQEALDEIRDALEDDLSVGEIFRHNLLPKAVRYYTGEIVGEDEYDDDDDDYDEDDDEQDDDDDEDDDEEEEDDRRPAHGSRKKGGEV